MLHPYPKKKNYFFCKCACNCGTIGNFLRLMIILDCSYRSDLSPPSEKAAVDGRGEALWLDTQSIGQTHPQLQAE